MSAIRSAPEAHASKILELIDITKTFPNADKPVVANDRVSLDLYSGEVHALVGENGTGKSTFMNILYGMLQPDSGEILIRGERVRFRNPRDAIAKGIGMVHQHFMLIDSFTVAENIVFTFEPRRRGGFVDVRRANQITRELSERFQLAVDPAKKVSECSLSMLQRVEILKILYHNAEILIFDEPTAVLTPAEAQELFKAFRELTRAGKSILFITHKLKEVFSVADRVTVMRKGRVVDTIPVAGSSMEGLAEMMVGRRIDVTIRQEAGQAADEKEREAIFEMRGLTTGPSPSGVELRGVDIAVRECEIVGVAGVGGNGQELIVEAAAGLLQNIIGGKMLYRDRDITSWNAHQIRGIGIAHITGERYVRGICSKTSILENMEMGAHRRTPYAGRLFMSPRRLRELARSLIERFEIKAPNASVPIMSLSGGNIQKCILARELNLANEFIIAEEPTRGVDIGSIEYIHRLLSESARSGFGVLLVSTDLDEILALSTRILVMFGGQVMGEVRPGDPDALNKIGLWMAGIRGEGMDE